MMCRERNGNQVELFYVNGNVDGRPYLWVGNNERCIGIIDDIGRLIELKNMCERAIAAKVPTMKGLDTYMDERFSEANEDGSPCAECGHPEESHVITGNGPECLDCLRLYHMGAQCEGYRPHDPDDNAPDDYNDPED